MSIVLPAFFLLLIRPDEITYGTVVCSFDFLTEKTGRQLTAAPVIVQTFAAFVFSGARLISAVTKSLVLI